MEDEVKLEFKTINNKLYVDIPIEVYNGILGFINILSNGEKDKFGEFLNTDLENSMISRFVASEYLNNNSEDLRHKGFEVIMVKINNRTIPVTVGIVHTSETEYEYIYGTLYCN